MSSNVAKYSNTYEYEYVTPLAGIQTENSPTVKQGFVLVGAC